MNCAPFDLRTEERQSLCLCSIENVDIAFYIVIIIRMDHYI